MPCPHTNDCELFPKFVLRQNLKFWKDNYCDADHSLCVRYQTACEGSPIPATLLPNGKELLVVIRKEDLSSED